MKATELKEQTAEELRNKLNDVKKNIFNLKFQKTIGQLENTMAIHNLKKDIARLETIIRQKEPRTGFGVEDKVSGKAETKKTPKSRKQAVMPVTVKKPDSGEAPARKKKETGKK
ncbi:MAG: 50S ribosomal protein L29 [Actinobacteria bacterium]|nr:50S ribosomal protein L29 [Actinomycetota bacterium]